jgi:hypothetical protein
MKPIAYFAKDSDGWWAETDKESGIPLYTSPRELRAEEALALTLTSTSTQFVKPPICTGEDLLTVVLSPNRPSLLDPQAHNVPSVLIAKEWAFTADTLLQFVREPICIGDDLNTPVLSPN